MQSLYQSEDLPDNKKVEQMNKVLLTITELTVQAMSYSIASIKSPESTVVNHEHIEDFLRNCEKSTYDILRDKMISMRESSEIKPLKFKCAHCSHEFDQPFTLDQVSFFGLAS